LICVVLNIAAFPFNLNADTFNIKMDRPTTIRELRELGRVPKDLNHIGKRPGYYSQDDWRTAIDSTWGEGMVTTAKLEIFDNFWTLADEMYASFHHLDVNWDSLYTVFRPEIEAGVSRGRFYAIMCQLYLALQDAHVSIFDIDILSSELKPGIPLLVVSGYLGNGHFGAGLTPLPDQSLLVYQVVPDHPLGLEPGDVVLGYHGIPWKDIYPDLLDAQLPVSTMYGWGSSESSDRHHWLAGAGMNWHLFDTIDVVKYGSNDTVHLPTSVLADQNMDIFCTAQMPIAGVSFPNINSNHVSWGVVDGTNIGYIYIWSWMKDNRVGDDFKLAVQSLLYGSGVQGLIIDSRMNLGGYPTEYFKALEILFNEDQDILISNVRDDPLDRYSLVPFDIPVAPLYFEADQSQICDVPIAVLIGPASVSAGDMMPLQMTAHPMVRTFGLPTNSAIGYVGIEYLQYSNLWVQSMAVSNTSLREDPDYYLTHVGFDVDEEVWLNPDDVRKGEDTVVKRAMEWIHTLAYAHDVAFNKTYIAPASDTLHVTATVENPDQDDLSVRCTFADAEGTVLDSAMLADDGLHNDGEPEDGVWGGMWMPLEEKSVRASIKTVNLSDDTYRMLPNVKRFTSVGPVVLEGLEYTTEDTIPNPGDLLKFKLRLKNEGAYASAENVTARISTPDDFVRIHVSYSAATFADIAANESVTADQEYRVIVSPYADEARDVHVLVEITSDDFVYWQDSFIIPVNLPTGVAAAENENTVPAEFALMHNYPNPFNPVTTIRYDLPEPADVRLCIYNVRGQLIETLVNAYQEAGYHDVAWNAEDQGSGIYFYRIEAGRDIAVKKCTLIR
jgi:hypothetical protein